ncbi:hypothetical protein C8R43DRAFT_705535 [Mycena crocata]|nr:hypothetical protein C8R43DRAFT_705535 [Mycena crocata]
MQDSLKVFLKWLDHWRNALLAWAAFSANLANQSPGYLLSHSYLLEIQRRPQDEAAKHSARSKFIAVLGGMRTDEEIQEEFRRNNDSTYRAQIIENFERIQPGPGTIRIVVICFPLYSNAGEQLGHIFPDMKAKAFVNPLSAESRLLSIALANAWAEKFADHVRTGNNTGHMEVLQKLIQGGQSLNETALSVD